MPGMLSHETPFTKTFHKTLYDAIDPTKPSLSAAGKTVLITAGHTGIGFAIAQSFGSAGASHGNADTETRKVIILARRVELLEKAAKQLSAEHPNTKFHYFSASITDYARIKGIFAQIRSEISPNIDVLVTSAAHISPPANPIDLPTEEISKTFECNFVGNANLAKEFLAGSSEAGTGAEKIILDISSFVIYTWLPYSGTYAAAKVAFHHWLCGVQQDMADKNVRFQSFHPGSIFTEAAKGFGMTEDSLSWDSVQLSGGFAVWLASKEASFLKGRFVWANWDVPELIQRKGEFESDPELLRIGLHGNPATQN